ncbi:MAG: class I SAM-dependent rRNA methyltransferase [Bacteroidia bacterium]
MFQQIVLKSGRDRSLRNRHPWVFSGAVKQWPDAENGEIVAVSDNQGQLLGYGFFSPKSQIVCRLFHFGAAPEHGFDQAYWTAKIERAVLLRKQLIDPAGTSCYRLLHAEGDFLPGIIVDVYGSVVVVQVLIKGVERIFEQLEKALHDLGFAHIYLKQKENSGFLEAVQLPKGWRGTPCPMPVRVLEHGLQFDIDVESGQKTGFFIDQRENRLLTQQFSAGKKVLNAFSYTGGFSLYALAGGAREVHSVDISKDAIARANELVALNFPGAKHLGVAADCFDYLKQTEDVYDLIVLDPPAFAKSAKAVNNAARGYKELNLVALKKIAPGGLLFTYSCSQNITPDLFRKIVFGSAADAGREVRILRLLSQADDHPINIYHPEGEYLKGLMLYVE